MIEQVPVAVHTTLLDLIEGTFCLNIFVNYS